MPDPAPGNHEPDDLDRRLHALADGVGETHVPHDLRRRVVRRRRTRTAITSTGSVAGVLLAGLVGFGVWNAQQPDPDVPPAQTAGVPTACSADALLGGTAQNDPDDAAAQDVAVTLDRGAPVSCTIATFRLVASDGTERVRARLADVTLDPGATVDLRLRWDASAGCSAQPVQVLADETVLASIAVPTCGDVTLDATVRPAS